MAQILHHLRVLYESFTIFSAKSHVWIKYHTPQLYTGCSMRFSSFIREFFPLCKGVQRGTALYAVTSGCDIADRPFTLLQKSSGTSTPLHKLESTTSSFSRKICPTHIASTTGYWSWDTVAVSDLRCFTHPCAGQLGMQVQSCPHSQSASNTCHCAVTHPRHSADTHPQCLRLQVKQPALAKCSFLCPGRGNVQSVRQSVLNWQHHTSWGLQHMHVKKINGGNAGGMLEGRSPFPLSWPLSMRCGFTAL